MSARGLFVTGTDTEIGKTLVTATLLYLLSARGFSVAGMKPISAGCERTPHGLRNEDALELLRFSGSVDYETVNPYAFEPAIAPHIAAAEAGVDIDLSKIIRCYHALAAERDLVLVEGAGGWRVPMSERSAAISDIPIELRLPVVLVVGVRLGCLNHALLTDEAVRGDGLEVVGWVANCMDPDASRIQTQVKTLRARLSAPCLGVVPALKHPRAEAAADHLDLAPILGSLNLDLSKN